MSMQVLNTVRQLLSKCWD